MTDTDSNETTSSRIRLVSSDSDTDSGTDSDSETQTSSANMSATETRSSYANMSVTYSGTDSASGSETETETSSGSTSTSEAETETSFGSGSEEKLNTNYNNVQQQQQKHSFCPKTELLQPKKGVKLVNTLQLAKLNTEIVLSKLPQDKYKEIWVNYYRIITNPLFKLLYQYLRWEDESYEDLMYSLKNDSRFRLQFSLFCNNVRSFLENKTINNSSKLTLHEIEFYNRLSDNVEKVIRNVAYRIHNKNN